MIKRKQFSNFSKLDYFSPAFTIVELLIVVVVIAILATLTIISFNGITKQAAAASLKSDLSSAIKQLEIAKVSNGSYPDDVDSLKKSSNTTYQYTKTDGNTFCLSATDSTQGFHIDSTTRTIEDGVCSGHSEPGAPTGDWKAISEGHKHTCAISRSDLAYCWGFNNLGQLGNNSTTNSSVPVAVNTSGVLSGKTIKSISAAGYHACVVASDDQAYCWGYGSSGQLGNNSTTNSSVPVAVNTSGVLSGKTIKSISAGGNHTCAIASNDQAYCWGNGGFGQLGNGTTNRLVPVAVNTSGVLSGKTIKSISAGGSYTCAIASDNQAYCWGGGYTGTLGNNSTSNSSVPVAVNTSGVLSGKTLKSISSSSSHTCVIANNDQAYCWGGNHDGELGNNSTTDSSVPVAVNTSGVLSGKTIKFIAGGDTHTCSIASDNLAYCWGYNHYGQLGNNSTTNSSVPVVVNISGVLSGKIINYISGGGNHTCAIASDNNAYCWGYNLLGQLGNNSTTESHVPVKVNSL